MKEPAIYDKTVMLSPQQIIVLAKTLHAPVILYGKELYLNGYGEVQRRTARALQGKALLLWDASLLQYEITQGGKTLIKAIVAAAQGGAA